MSDDRPTWLPAADVLAHSVAVIETWRSMCADHHFVEHHRLPLVSHHDPSVRFTNSTICVLKPLLTNRVTTRHFLIQPAMRLRNMWHFRGTGEMSPFGCSFMAFGLLAPADRLDDVCRLGARFVRSLPLTEQSHVEYRAWCGDSDIVGAASDSGLPLVVDTTAARPYRHVFGMDGVAGRNTNLHVGAPAVANVIVIERDAVPVAVELAFGINMILVGAGLVGHPVLATPAAAAGRQHGIEELISLDALHTATMLAMEGMVPGARGRRANYRDLLTILCKHAGDRPIAEAAAAASQMEAALRVHASPPCPSLPELSPAETTHRLCGHLDALL